MNVTDIRDIICEMPCLDITSNKKAVLCGVSSVLEYSSELVCLDCEGLNVTIRGVDISLGNLSHREITVSGCFTCVEFSGSGANIK